MKIEWTRRDFHSPSEYFEPEAPALQRRCSAVELRAHCDYEKVGVYSLNIKVTEGDHKESEKFLSELFSVPYDIYKGGDPAVGSPTATL